MNPFDKFTEKAQEVLTNSYQILMEARHSQLDVEHILMAMLQQIPNPQQLRSTRHLL